MKKFKVVAFHIGDKEYAPGDTREADPTEVRHLVPGTLEPDGWSYDDDGSDGAGADDVADLRQQVEQLTKERDEARSEVEALKKDAHKKPRAPGAKAD